MFDIYDFIGLTGVALSVYSYGRVQWQRDFAKRLSYSLLNLAGSLLFGVSLINHWNIASFISNLVWGLISIYGVYRCFKYIRRARIVEARLMKRRDAQTRPLIS